MCWVNLLLSKQLLVVLNLTLSIPFHTGSSVNGKLLFFLATVVATNMEPLADSVIVSSPDFLKSDLRQLCVLY